MLTQRGNQVQKMVDIHAEEPDIMTFESGMLPTANPVSRAESSSYLSAGSSPRIAIWLSNRHAPGLSVR